jgi:carboxylate-amine ligase
MRRLSEDDGFGYDVTSEMRAIVCENRWRIQRFGTEASIVDPQTLAATSVAKELATLARILGDDADALGCREEFDRWQTILATGTAADRQIAIYDEARAAGASRMVALRAVMSWLIAETARESANEALAAAPN